MKGIRIPSAVLLLAAIATAFAVLCVVLASMTWYGASAASQDLHARMKPAEIRVTVIRDAECDRCSDLEDALDALQGLNVTMASRDTLELGSDEATSLIEQHEITRVPTFLATGELDKHSRVANWFQAAGDTDDQGTFVFRSTVPPYRDPVSGEVRGIMTLVYLEDASCEQCYDVAAHDNALANLLITPSETKRLDVSSEEGQALVSAYGITDVPTIILQGDLDPFEFLGPVWDNVGTVEEDGARVFRSVEIMGTYKNLETGEVKQAG